MDDAVIFFLAVCACQEIGTKPWSTIHGTYVVPMSEMTTIWQTETHQTILRLNECGQSSKAINNTFLVFAFTQEIPVRTLPSKTNNSPIDVFNIHKM
jgi:hypothetical protein